MVVAIRNWHLTIKLNEIDTREYDMYQKERVTIPTAEEDVQTVYVKGREGELTKKYGYKDIPFSVDFFYFEKGKSFKESFRKFKAKFMNSKTLIIDDDGDVFYFIKSMEIEEAINDRRDIGEFTINFTLAPFQYEYKTIHSRSLKEQ